LTCFFKAYEPIRIGALKITAFPKLHDAIDPHSFVVENKETRIGVFTDIGSVCPHVIQNFKSCHAVFLEANYDVKMLEEGRYPFHLKSRICGTHGHLALQLFLEQKPAYMTHLFLSHLSKDNNCPVLAKALFEAHAGTTTIEIASRYNEIGVFLIHGKAGVKRKNTARLPGQQMSLF
jgi:phosphoribosyl 1,2-cyclic phosphodiesterase